MGMAHLLRISLALVLALVVTLTGHASAAAQGARDASGQIVICSGSGPVTIYIDDQGQPTQPPHYCPDCVMHLLDAVPAPDALVLPSYAGQAYDRSWVSLGLHHRPKLTATARAPPVAV